MEVLVAATIVGVVLAATFGWLWNVAALAGRADDRAQAGTTAAGCARAVASEVSASVAVVAPPLGRDPASCLALVRDRPGLAQEDVLIVWQPGRRVVWRNAPGTYLADHITAFAVAYELADGRLVEGGSMEREHWCAVRAVRVDLASEVGSGRAERSMVVAAVTL